MLRWLFCVLHHKHNVCEVIASVNWPTCRNMKWKLRTLLLFLVTGALVVTLTQVWNDFKCLLAETAENIYYENQALPKSVCHGPGLSEPIILWWTPFTGEQGNTKKCGFDTCFFTQDRKYRNHPMTLVYMFYASNIDVHDLPLPRNGPSVMWAVIHEESPKNILQLMWEPTLSLFNYTATFSRKSDFPLTLQYLPGLDGVIATKYFVPTLEKNKMLGELAPVVYVQSSCSTPSNRDAYILELMKYIAVDSYGECLNNKMLPERLSGIENMYEDDFLHFIARYKFILTFENALCEDYITEKLWRALIVGSVPVYLGSPSVRDWLPNNDSAILVSDFKSPKQLAEFLTKLNQNVSMYNQYLEHKLYGEVRNTHLLSALAQRSWEPDGHLDNHFVGHFQCFVCNKVHKNMNNWSSSVATAEHYSCPVPVSPLTGKTNKSNWWVDTWRSSQCDALAIRACIDKGVDSLDKEELQKEIDHHTISGAC